MDTKNFKTRAIQWHRKLAWVGGVGLLVFAFSGLLHPIMVWTSPQAKAFFPPKLEVSTGLFNRLVSTIQRYDLREAGMMKVIATHAGPMLQVTPAANSAGIEPRRYFDLSTDTERPGFEWEHAAWLGAYYTGLPQELIRRIELKTEFDNEYPWVNRLLPVYRIEYERGNNLVAFVYTETNALASLSNERKRFLQTLFGVLHTWSWLDSNESLRVAMLASALLCVIALVVAGTFMFFRLKRRKIPDRSRRLHRALAGYLLWLPLLLFSTSGLFHLLQSSYGSQERGMQLGEGLMLDPQRLMTPGDRVASLAGKAINSISIVQRAGGEVAYRMSVAAGEHHQMPSKNARFDGRAAEKRALYVDAYSGKQLDYTDLEHTEYLVTRFKNIDRNQISNLALITRFGPDYDFRNKRLPVWMVNVENNSGLRLFVDPASGLLVDQLEMRQRIEGYSFSLLHKWNFLRPLVGRETRDAIMSGLMCATLVIAILGLRLSYKRLQNRGRPVPIKTERDSTANTFASADGE